MREHHLLLHLDFPPHTLFLHGDSEGADLPHKPPPPPPSIYLFRVQKLHSTRKKKMKEGGGKKKDRRGREGVRQTHKHTAQVQQHTRGRDTHIHCTRTHKHVHTLLVEHLNHISCLPAIRHSHRQKHMPERQRKCMATCITTHKQTRSVTEQSTHF